MSKKKIKVKVWIYKNAPSTIEIDPDSKSIVNKILLGKK